MADVMPDYRVEQQRLRSQIAAQRAAIEAQKLAILEMADRKRRHIDNITAAERAITDYQTQLTGLETTHGTLTEDEIRARTAFIDDTRGVNAHG